MKIIDIILLVPLIFGAYKGYQKGLILEIVQFFSLIIALVLGLKLYEIGMFYLRPVVGDFYGFLSYLSFAIIFLGSIMLINWMGKKLKDLAKMVLLGWMDKILGAALALLKWGIALSILVWFLYRNGIHPRQDVIEQTFIYYPMVKLAPAFISALSLLLPFLKSLVRSI